MHHDRIGQLRFQSTCNRLWLLVMISVLIYYAFITRI